MESVLSPYVKNESVFETNFCVFGERVIEKQKLQNVLLYWRDGIINNGLK